MTQAEFQSDDDRRLWRRYADATGASNPPTVGELAGWLDGRVDDDGSRDDLEGRIADHPEAIIAIRDLVAERERADDEVLLFVPPTLLERAKRLVSDRTHRVPHTPAARRWALVRWAVSVAAAIVICAVGFRLGGGATATEERPGKVLDELSFGVLDETEPTDFDELMLVLGGGQS